MSVLRQSTVEKLKARILPYLPFMNECTLRLTLECLYPQSKSKKALIERMASSNAASDPTILASKRAVYVGGLASEVTPALLRAAMIPFGDIKSLDIPMDYQKGVHRGFGFVEYEDADDASEAIFNMDGADLMGKTLKVSVAQPNQMNKLSTTQQAVWNNDEWFQQHVTGDSEKDREELKQKQQDEQVLTEAIH